MIYRSRVVTSVGRAELRGRDRVAVESIGESILAASIRNTPDVTPPPLGRANTSMSTATAKPTK